MTCAGHAVSRRQACAGLLAAALGGMGGAARAQAPYPSKALSMIVPWPPGGPADFYARIYQEPLQKRLGQPVVVENLAGVSGALGVKRLLDAAPDGHTLALLGAGETILAPLGLAAVKHRAEDVRVVAMMGSGALVLLARPGLPLSTLDQLADGARQPPLTYGHTGNGSLYHLAAERLGQLSGLTLSGVPYKGAAPILNDLAGGHVDLAFLPMSGPVVGMVRQGRFRALAHTARERQAQLPDLPALPSHPRLRELEFDVWLSLAVRRDTPETVATRLNAAANEVLMEPAVHKASAETGGRAARPRTLAENEHLYQSEISRYRAIAQSIGLQPQ